MIIQWRQITTVEDSKYDDRIVSFQILKMFWFHMSDHVDETPHGAEKEYIQIQTYA